MRYLDACIYSALYIGFGGFLGMVFGHFAAGLVTVPFFGFCLKQIVARIVEDVGERASQQAYEAGYEDGYKDSIADAHLKIGTG